MLILTGMPDLDPPQDPNFANVRMLLHGTGPNGGTTFTDRSSFGYAVSAFGDAQTSTTQFKFGGSSMAFDGVGDYLTSDFTFPAPSNTDMTVECWFYATALDSNRTIWDLRAADGDYEPVLLLFGTELTMYVTDNSRATMTVATNTWYHAAITRTSNVYRMFVNGTQVGSNFADGTTLTRRALTIASRCHSRTTSNTGKFAGYIDDFRFTLGTARYTSNFTTPIDSFPDL